MDTTSITLKTINDLLGDAYFVPAYQRGYRWGEQQVSELLDDILAYQASEEGGSRDGFYCLQPVVVKARSVAPPWEVVDGQQRLTTILLVLQYLNQRMTERYRRNIYTIDFETRPGCKDYLTDMKEDQSEDYSDYYYLYRAKGTIARWFEGKQHLVNDFEAALLNRVKVIWYQLRDDEVAVDAFTRLNVGKIPLTDAELVRALFLRSKNFHSETADLERLRIAQEWDAIEKSLQDDDFWYFLANDGGRPNRIEFIFNLIADARAGTGEHLIGDYTTFHHFSRMLTKDGATADELWSEVKQYHLTLEEWYRDDKLFHLIGYLINEGDSVLELIKLSRSMGKEAFRIAIRERIASRLRIPSPEVGELDDNSNARLDEYLDDLDYGRDHKRIKSVLLLFNIVSIIANDKSIVRFRFDYFKKERWDIEHIRSVNSLRPRANVDKRPWLEAVQAYFEETSDQGTLHGRATAMLATQGYTTGDAFDLLYEDVIEHFGEKESSEAENGIGNLALLDSGSNRGYRNAVFPIKRRRLLQYDQEGTFVPLCTRNVFLKCYSEKLDNMFFWIPTDQADYRTAIRRMLLAFFNH